MTAHNLASERQWAVYDRPYQHRPELRMLVP